MRNEGVVEDGKGLPAVAAVVSLVDASCSHAGHADEDSRESSGGLGGVIEGHPGESDLLGTRTTDVYLVL